MALFKVPVLSTFKRLHQQLEVLFDKGEVDTRAQIHTVETEIRKIWKDIVSVYDARHAAVPPPAYTQAPKVRAARPAVQARYRNGRSASL